MAALLSQFCLSLHLFTGIFLIITPFLETDTIVLKYNLFERTDKIQNINIFSARACRT